MAFDFRPRVLKFDTSNEAVESLGSEQVISNKIPVTDSRTLCGCKQNFVSYGTVQGRFLRI